jgi:hypothetical protein
VCFGEPDARTPWPVVKGENERFQANRFKRRRISPPLHDLARRSIHPSDARLPRSRGNFEKIGQGIIPSRAKLSGLNLGANEQVCDMATERRSYREQYMCSVVNHGVTVSGERFYLHAEPGGPVIEAPPRFTCTGMAECKLFSTPPEPAALTGCPYFDKHCRT